MSSQQKNPNGNLETEGLSPEGAEPEQEQEQESPSQLVNSRTQKGANGSGTIKVTG